ncbi:MAG: helix-turn-helix transcriptional regulator [Eubacteriales bacterium]
MAISYNKLWKKLIDEGMNKGDLREKTGISTGTIAKMTNGEPVTLTVMEKICNELQCDIGDLVEIIFENKDK